MVRALAIVCVRNEAVHVRRCLNDLIASGVDVVLIDHESTDGTVEIAQDFLGQGLISIETMTWTGKFSLSEQLRVKRKVIARSNHDWIIHADADEWLCSPVQGQSLIEGIVEADMAGYNVINFHEIVFVPLAGEDFFAADYASRMNHYYFFQPSYPRLNRAWKRSADLANVGTGGHRLIGGDLRLFPHDFLLRHYIALSELHARTKYVGRRFSDEDLKRGWHRNRQTITADVLKVKQIPGLMRMDNPGCNHFDLTMPMKTHFWEW
jgi:glycosyltransferase involved in cell wall biosynthesis